MLDENSMHKTNTKVCQQRLCGSKKRWEMKHTGCSSGKGMAMEGVRQQRGVSLSY